MELQTRSLEISRIEDSTSECVQDQLAVEEPLEIRLLFQEEGRRVDQSISVTMRTPGQDRELALGFLYGEGILEDLETQVAGAGPRTESPACNVVQVELRPGVVFDRDRLQRNFYTTSSCGICSKASLEALEMTGCRSLEGIGQRISREVLYGLSQELEKFQSVFSRTGGLHASALFDPEGKLICLREDVGRHNAVDKVVGHLLLEGRLPLNDFLLMVSGRTSFEILQKALMAGIPTVAAVSAPSSLAVETARKYGMTLIGFLRGRRFNIYSHAERVD